MSTLTRFVLSPFIMVLMAVLLLSDSGLNAQAYDAGFRTITFIDSDRNNREIECEIYHPAESAGQNVPMASGQFPHIVFGHGFLMNVGAYESIATALAEEGFIVLLPTTEGGLSPNHSNFAQDLAFVADEVIEKGGDPGSFFYNHLNEKFALGGHSMGGGCTYLAVQYLENEVNTLFTFAAAETNPSAIAQMSELKTSNLILAGELDCVTPPEDHQLPMYMAQSGNDCTYYLEIDGGYHCQFNDFNFNCNLGETFCSPPGGLTREQQIETVLELLIPWLKGWLYRDCAAWDTFESIMDNEDGFEKTYSCNILPLNDPLVEILSPLPACPGEEVELEALQTSGDISWNTGDSAVVIAVSESGDYSYTLSNEVCVKTSPSVSVEFSEKIHAEVLSPEGTELCPESELLLEASPAVGNILWSHGEDSPSVYVNQGGFYSFSIEVDNCIFESNELFISEVPDPLLEVIAPEGDVLCENGSLPLFISQAANSVSWNTGESGFDIEVSEAGEYYYEAEIDHCIFQSSSLFVTLDDPGPIRVEYSGEPTLCPGDSAILSSGLFQGDLIWSDGSHNSEIVVSASGSYYYQAFTENCVYQSDTIQLEVLDSLSPIIHSPGLLNLCPGDSLALSASTTQGNISWNTGSTEFDLIVYSPGEYYYTIDTAACLFYSDTIVISAEENLNPEIRQPDGLTICQGKSVELKSSIDELEVIWSTGDTSSSIAVATAGSYYYVINQGNCLYFSDTVTVQEAPIIRPTVDSESGTTLCPGSELQLSTNVSYTPLWSTGDTSQSIIVNIAGSYYYTFEANNCLYKSDSIAITKVDSIELQLLKQQERPYCPGDSILLIAHSDTGTIEWNNGWSADSLWVTESGKYYFEVRASECIFFSDTVDLAFEMDWSVDEIRGPDTIRKDAIYFYDVAEVQDVEYLWSGEFIEIIGPNNRNFVEIQVSTELFSDTVVLNLLVYDSVCKEVQLNKIIYVDRLNTISETPEWDVLISHHYNFWKIENHSQVGSWNFIITDVSGRLLHQQFNETTTELKYFHHHLPQGIYFILLQTAENREFVQKVIKY